MLSVFLFFTLLVPTLSHFHSESVDFVVTYQNDMMFSTALDSQYRINNTLDNFENCSHNCAIDKKCLGMYEELEPEYSCSSLSNLGDPIDVNGTSNSYMKITHSNYENKEHSITGFLWDTYEIETNLTSTFYLDLNHNGVWEEGEPKNETTSGSNFYFDNLAEGFYLIRQIIPENCNQIYPGLNSSFNVYKGNGYTDNVIRYLHHGHPTHQGAHGGFVGETGDYLNKNFSFLTGNDNTTYLSLYNDYSITLNFIDESVSNRDDNDIFIDMYNHSEIYANVSVSTNNIDYFQIGVLNTSEAYIINDTFHRQEFDLQDFKTQVLFIKLDFFGEGNINLVRIGVYENSIYMPAYSYLISVPQNEWVFFVNDCHMYYSCSTHCGVNFYYNNDFFSCLQGCVMFEENRRCNCLEYDGPQNFIDYYDDYYDDYYVDDQLGTGYFNYHICENGCHYAMRKYVYPEYSVLDNQCGYPDSRMYYQNNITLDNLLDICNNDTICGSIGLDVHSGGSLYNSHRHIDHINHTFLMKNDHFTTTETSTTITSTTLSSTTKTSTETSTTITSTTNTETSTTNTDTSTTNTETSTTNTDTSTTNTDTSTTNTDTSTTNTDTSTTNTDTSTTNTDTSTTNPNNSIIVNPDASTNNRKSNTTRNTLLGVFGGVIGIGVVMGGLLTRNYLRNKRIIRDNQISNTQLNNDNSYDNPLYAYGKQNPNVVEYDDSYQDVNSYQGSEVNRANDDYLEVE
jgi:hypothetical protein